MCVNAAYRQHFDKVAGLLGYACTGVLSVAFFGSLATSPGHQGQSRWFRLFLLERLDAQVFCRDPEYWANLPSEG